MKDAQGDECEPEAMEPYCCHQCKPITYYNNGKCNCCYKRLYDYNYFFCEGYDQYRHRDDRKHPFWLMNIDIEVCFFKNPKRAISQSWKSRSTLTFYVPRKCIPAEKSLSLPTPNTDTGQSSTISKGFQKWTASQRSGEPTGQNTASTLTDTTPWTFNQRWVSSGMRSTVIHTAHQSNSWHLS